MAEKAKSMCGDVLRSRWSLSSVRRGMRTSMMATALCSLGCFEAAHAVAQAVASDAQVEANVLKALAGAPELANESISTRTVAGVVTLSGAVGSEGMRRQAELLAANADGVTKVVDELRLSTQASDASTRSDQPQGSASQENPHGLLQSDGTYASVAADPAESEQNPPAGTAPAVGSVRNDPEADQELDRQADRSATQNPPVPDSQGRGAPGEQDPANSDRTSRPPNGAGYPPYPVYRNGPGFPAGAGDQGQARYPDTSDPRNTENPSYGGYPPYGAYPSGQPGGRGYGRQPLNGPQGYPGQIAGQAVTIPAGALLRVRLNRTLSSEHSLPGTTFDALVVNDVVAGGVVAIPRGASVQGSVVDANSSGVLKGRGEISIQLTQVTLGGRTYPIASDLWSHHGGDKTIETVNRTAGFGAAGAVIGAIAGGGVGAAVGGGIGAAAGLGSSAASGHGQVVLPSESVMTFHLAQPAEVATVSEQELQRLAYGVAPGADPREFRPGLRPRAYFAPGYYPSYYRGYYPPYPPYYRGPVAGYGYPPY